jgi:hypothetical protein
MVVHSKVLLQGVVIQIVLRLAWIQSIAYVTSFMLLSTMGVQFVVAVEMSPAKSAFWMSTKTTLIGSARFIVALFFMSLQLLFREQLMLMRKDFFIPRAEVAHHFTMN